MQVIVLVDGEDALEQVRKAALPNGVTRKHGKYGNDGLYVVEFQTDDDTVSSAARLAELRDSVICGNVKILRDDPSELFCRRLYPKVMRFERDLRMALIIAFNSNGMNFDNEFVSSLESQGIGELGKVLFFDKRLNKLLQDLVNGKKGAILSKMHVLDAVQKHEDCTTWDKLFGDDLPSVKRRFTEIKDTRNDVMHFHTMGYQRYRRALGIFHVANSELSSYVQNCLSDVRYPSHKAADAREAVKTLTDAYSSIAQNLASSVRLVEALKQSALFNVDSDWINTIQDGLTAYKDVSSQVADASRLAMSSIDMTQIANLTATQKAMAETLSSVADALRHNAQWNMPGHDGSWGIGASETDVTASGDDNSEGGSKCE